ncbi:Vacuolar protein sorting-associated protein 33B [Geodia barretti]|uniref:Vacuolar protein sorting-associated protein 33B n=1 Tax=Geodia barretti TaxID=519541 RepID=A0AA35TGH3_GEOBA|nr:Vacuolar protein sorting-associated protein 33B [Geodia barretti]
MSELGENGAVLSLDETDGAQLPDLKDVAEIARTQFADMLASEEGKKDLVIQGELMTLLEHVTPINFLKKLEVEHIYRIEPVMDQGGTKRFYVTRPDMLAVSQIADHIQSDSRARRNREYVVIFVPRRLASCEYILEREGVHGLIRYMELKLHLIPLDEHILSLERNKSLFTLHIDGDMSMLHSVAESILLLERHHGTIPVVHGKGHLASMVWSLYSRLKDAHQVGTLHHEGGSQITELVLFDRSCDYVTPLCSQLTYEGILDDTFGIKSGFVEVGEEIMGKNVKVLLNARDPVYKIIRSMHFSSVPSVLCSISKELKSDYSEWKPSQTIPELKNFVQKLPELRRKHDSLETHLKVSEQIIVRKREAEYERQLYYERAILEAVDKCPIAEYVEECIHRQVNFHIPLRLLCLMSTTNGGIKNKYWKILKDQFLQSYGYKFLDTLHNLEKAGVVVEKPEDSSAPSSFKLLSKNLKLVPKEPETANLHNPSKMSYVFGGAFKPLSVAAIEFVTRVGSWNGLDDVVANWSGPAFTHKQGTSQRKATQTASRAHRVVLVYFLGGCTFSEINALRFLGEKTGIHYIVATTNLLNANTLLDSFIS